MADLGNCPDLKTSIDNKIYTNPTFDVSAEDIRSSFEDTIDTLCAKIDLLEEGSGCEVLEINEVSSLMSVTGRRIVCNDNSIEFDLTINYSNTNSGDSITLTDMIPLDFKSKKWFKAGKFISIINEINTNGDFGEVTFNDLSSYNNGTSTSGDSTTVHIAGNTLGKMRIYDWDADSYISSDIVWQSVDGSPPVNPGSGPSYPDNSPKDITVEPLNIVLTNRAASSLATGQTAEGTVRLYFKGILL